MNKVNNKKRRPTKSSEKKACNNRILKGLCGVYGVIGAIGMPVLGFISMGPLGLGVGLTAAGLSGLALRKTCA